MTRFARAKGSKASNERTPESATPWKEMKQSLSNNQANEKSESQQPVKTDLNLFKKSLSAEEKKNTKWSTFYDDLYNQNADNTNKKHQKKKPVKDLQSDTQFSEEQCTAVDINNAAKAKLKRKKKLNEDFEEDTEKEQPNKFKSPKNEEVINKKQKKEKRLKNPQSEEQKTGDSEVKVTHKKKFDKNPNDESEKNQSKNQQVTNNKKHKKEKHVQNLQSDNQFVEEQPTNDGGFKNKRKFNDFNKGFEQQPETKQFKKFKKDKDPTEYKRRKPGSEFNKVFINGNEIEIEFMDGFPVRKADAQRIKQLKKDMISKGIPRSEINAALKLERRKAEKALARERKKVCFNCRQSGHTLSECTQLRKESNADQFGTGICFKCGSTEHTHFECKVQRGDNFNFAQCFICKEQGHIARQCPDNSRGLYPKGGACRVCGDVTHLKKDCPKYQAEQEQHQIVADTINNDNIESLEYETTKSNKKPQNPRKIIKFQ